MAPECPTCALDIVLPAGTLPSEVITCQDCGEELEVIATTGGAKGDGTLKKAPEVKEDWGE